MTPHEIAQHALSEPHEHYYEKHYAKPLETHNYYEKHYNYLEDHDEDD